MGSIYKRKSDGKWVGSVFLGTDDYGKKMRKVVYGKTEKEVKKKVNQIEFEINNGLYVKDTKDTLIGFLNEYIKLKMESAKPWAQTTESLYKMYVRVHFEPYFKDKRLDKVKPIDIDKFYSYKLEDLDGNTVIKLHKFLNAAFNFGLKKDMVKYNPCFKADPPEFTEYVPNVYNTDQFLKLWDYVQDKYDRVPIALGAGAGLRRGEIFGLCWKNVDFKKNMITIEQTRVRFDKVIEKDPKTKKSARTISVPDYVIDTLRSYMKEKQVINQNERILDVTPTWYSQRFGELLAKFGLPKTRLHDLRHFNATLMMNSGVPDKVAAERLGHADTTMLKRVYQHVQTSADKNASDKLNIVNKKNIS